jgi:hypothetical protein
VNEINYNLTNLRKMQFISTKNEAKIFRKFSASKREEVQLFVHKKALLMVITGLLI